MRQSLPGQCWEEPRANATCGEGGDGTAEAVAFDLIARVDDDNSGTLRGSGL